MNVMPNRGLTLLFVAALALLAGASLAAAMGDVDSEDRLQTSVTLFVGQPDADTKKGPSVTIVPGTVVLADTHDVDENVDLALLRARLQETYRLAELRTLETKALSMALDREENIRIKEIGVEVGLTLLGFDDALATYHVRIADSGHLVATPVVSVERGGRAIVGGQDEGGRSYFFVLVAPPDVRAADTPLKQTFTPPEIIDMVHPVYPEEARDEKTEGRVILQGIIEKDGTVRELKVLKSPSGLLSEAALAAVKKWRYEPARTTDGKPVRVHWTMAVSFALQ